MRYLIGIFLVGVLLFVPLCIFRETQTIPFVPSGIHWPIDLLRNHRMTMNTVVLDYDVTLVQVPSDDFYQTVLIVKKVGGEKFTRFMIGIDDSKIRDPQIIVEDGVVYFCDGPKTGRVIADLIRYNDSTAGLSGRVRFRILSSTMTGHEERYSGKLLQTVMGFAGDQGN